MKVLLETDGVCTADTFWTKKIPSQFILVQADFLFSFIRPSAAVSLTQ